MLNTSSIEVFQQLNFKGLKEPKRRHLEQQFSNPIIKVDVNSGKIQYNRLKEVWDSQSVLHIA